MSALLSTGLGQVIMPGHTLTGPIALNGDQIRASISNPMAPSIYTTKMGSASKPARDRKYLDFLRSEGVCDACGYHVQHYATDPAHGPVNGMGSKGSDLEAIPLCRIHHQEQHVIGWKAFCAKYNLDRKELVAYWNQAYTAEKVNYG